MGPIKFNLRFICSNAVTLVIRFTKASPSIKNATGARCVKTILLG